MVESPKTTSDDLPAKVPAPTSALILLELGVLYVILFVVGFTVTFEFIVDVSLGVIGDIEGIPLNVIL